MVLQPDSSIEGGPETAALYFKFPTFFNKEQLYDHIQKHGFGNNVVAIDMHYRKFTKTPAGSAKVSIVPPALMEVFIEALHGTCLPGEYQQLLSVQPYVQKEDQPHKVFVGSGLPHTVTQEDIQMHFVKLRDEITNVEIKREKKRNTCYVLIAFRSKSAAKQAVDIYHHTIFLEKRIKVEIYQPEKMMRTLFPTPNMYAAISTTGSKVRQKLRDANSKGETYTDKSVSKSSAHYSSAMATKLKMGYSHVNVHSRSRQRSISDKRKKSSTVIVIAENLDPKFSKTYLEHLTNVRIDNYTPSHLTPDKAAAWIEVCNDTDARIIADCLNERNIAGREIHCTMAKSTALYKLMNCGEAKAQVHSVEDYIPCSIVSKSIHAKHRPLPVAADECSFPQIMESDMKEMACYQPLASISSTLPLCLMHPIRDV